MPLDSTTLNKKKIQLLVLVLVLAGLFIVDHFALHLPTPVKNQVINFHENVHKTEDKLLKMAGKPQVDLASERICIQQCEANTRYQENSKKCENPSTRCDPDDKECPHLSNMMQKNRCLYKAYKPFEECGKLRCGS